MDNDQPHEGPCVYVIKSGKRHYKIGKTGNLPQRLSAYRTHLPTLFRVVRQYNTVAIDELEEALHVIFQHKRIRGEWFALIPGDLVICDNLARGYHLEKLKQQSRKAMPVQIEGDPLLNVLAANEKYLKDYSKVAEDIKLGLNTEEIVEMNEGTVSKTTIQTVRRLLRFQTPNSTYVSQWLFVAADIQAGLKERELLDKYGGEVTRSTIATIRRILKNQLF